MKRTLPLTLVFVLMFSAFMLAACKSGDGKDALNTTNPPTATATATAAAEPTAEPETEAPFLMTPVPRPDTVTVEWLAEELYRRYYAGCINRRLMDYSDIMDRNEKTDLFFYDNQLEILLYELGYPFEPTDVSVYPIESMFVVDESNTEITVSCDIYMSLPTSSGSAYEPTHYIELTVDKQRMVIVGYGESSDPTRYNTWLSLVAARYLDQGLTWEEADKKAYEYIRRAYLQDTAEHPRSTTPQ